MSKISKYNEFKSSQVEPATKPTTAPDKEKIEEPSKPSIDPFKRRPNIKPGEEPKPKAKTKKFAEMFEKAINYDSTHSGRMNKELEKNLEKDKHNYSNHPAFPNKTEQHFAELISGNRFNELVKKIRYYLSDENFDNFNIMQMMQLTMASIGQIEAIEKTHIKELETLAVSIAKRMFNISKDAAFQFKAKIKHLSTGNISIADIPKKSVKQNFEEATEQEAEDFSLEQAKRRLLNGLAAGAANKGHYAFNMAYEELNKINPKLLNLYGLMISSNDMNYWLFSDAQMKQTEGEEGEEGSSAGKTWIDFSTEPPTINAVGINFPALLHELIKGTMEYLSLYGLPEKNRQKVLDTTDHLEAERFDLLLGPGLWDKFIDMINHDDKFEIDDIKYIVYAQLAQMPAREFHQTMKEILSGSDRGKKLLKDLAIDVRKELNQENADNAIKSYTQYKDEDNEDDIDISDAFKK